jgi:ABC-2 type transport system ATP-binding protein
MTLNNSSGGDDFVVLRGVSKSYGSFRALDNVSFEIVRGEIFGYIGPNGAGKTTTMKILVGLLGDFQGEVRIGGCELPAQKGEIHKLLGYLPQNVAFQEWRTVDHALRTFGRLSGVEGGQIESRIVEVLSLLSLSDVRHKKISQLSGGMIQKVGLAQALLHSPKLLVLDEPLAELDPLSRHQFKELVLKLGKEGTTVFFSSHILSDVQDVANRVGILNRGRIRQVGTLEELTSRLSDRKEVEVVFSDSGGKLPDPSSVKELRTVEQPSADRLVFKLEPEADVDQATDNIIRILVKAGRRIRSVAPLSPNLDEIYLKYVQEDANA